VFKALDIEDEVDNVVVSAGLFYDYLSNGSYIASGEGTLSIIGLQDDGSDLIVAMYLLYGHSFIFYLFI
jgi:hypothetical protein